MASLLQNDEFKSIGARFGKLKIDMKPRWGKMNPARTMWHCAIPIQVALGEKTMRGGPGFLKWGFVRRLVIHKVPFPKNAPTGPELIAPSQADFAKAKADLTVAMNRFKSKGGGFQPSPVFGDIDANDWGVLIWRHLDHHLRQFGL